MDSPYAPPVNEVEAKKPRSLGKVFLFGCTGTVALCTLLIATCVVSMESTKSKLGPECVKYIHLLEDKKYDEAYSRLGDEAKAEIPIEKHRAVMSGFIRTLGPTKYLEIQSVFTRVDPQGHWCRIIYKAEFEKGPGTIHFELRSYSGVYKINSVHFQSPILTDLVNETLSKTN